MSPLNKKQHMSCQARILDTEFMIPGTTEKCYTTKECGAEIVRKIVVDNGDANQKICKDCFKRFATKSSEKSSWYGWFDCEYPKDARVKYSLWYNNVSLASAATGAAKKTEDEDAAEVENLVQKVEMVTLVTSKKEMLLQEIEVIKTWFTGEGKAKYKEQPKMHKKIIDLKVQLKLLKK